MDKALPNGIYENMKLGIEDMFGLNKFAGAVIMMMRRIYGIRHVITGIRAWTIKVLVISFSFLQYCIPIVVTPLDCLEKVHIFQLHQMIIL